MSLGPGFTDGVTSTVYPSKSLLARARASDSLSRNLYFLSASLSIIKKSSTSTKCVTFNVNNSNIAIDMQYNTNEAILKHYKTNTLIREKKQFMNKLILKFIFVLNN